MIAAIIQARLDSKRFPRKILQPLWGKIILLRVVEAVQKSRVDRVIVACPLTDHRIIYTTLLKNSRVSSYYYPGSEEDVLARYYYAAKEFKVDTVIRITSDCPFVRPEMINYMIEKFKKGSRSYLSNRYPREFVPSGYDVEIFSFELLEKAHLNAVSLYDREHVTPFMKRTTKGGLNDFKFSIDTKEELDFFSKQQKGKL